MNAMARQQERTANNLANANTIGYKRDRSFTQALDEHLDAEGAPRSSRLTTQWASTEQGTLERTDNPLDVAISGEGFFVLSDEMTGTQRFTRAGNFLLDNEGTLRDQAGFLVEGLTGAIQFPPNVRDISIDSDGGIHVNSQMIGKLRVVTFDNPLGLQRLDGAAFNAAGMEPVEINDPDIKQGHLEQSNVDPLRELTEMITHFRLYEAQSKVLQNNDQVLGRITRDLGRF